jgi:esterase/lipase superfamily enzyme
MRFLVLMATGIVLVAPQSSMSQSNPDLAISASCTQVQSAKLDTLEMRKTALEQAVTVKHDEIDSLVAKRGNSSTVPEDEIRLKSLTEELRAQEGELIDLLYQMECYRADLQENTEVSRGSVDTIAITTFYATNRKPTGRVDVAGYYSGEDTRELRYGQITVTIPTAHTIGQLELPSLWKLERSPDPRKHFVLKEHLPLAASDAAQKIRTALESAKSKSLLLFVHGFNTTFADAALRTAQIAYDLRFSGIAMFYSWPSAGRSWGYLHDEESTQLAKSIFDRLLDDLSLMAFNEIYLIAHSMGNRIVGNTMASRVEQGKPVSTIREILLGAPDINAELFKTEIVPKLTALQNTTKTIYASSKDIALRASKIVHGFKRVGETAGGILTYPGFETIDASGSAPIVRGFGHSYVFDSVAVLNDIEDSVIWRQPSGRRNQVGLPPDVYWNLR